MRLYQIDFPKLAVMLLPTFMRGALLAAMARLMMRPIQSLHDRWLDDCASRDYALNHTGQVCSIKAVLDDRFGLAYTDGFTIDDIDTVGEWAMTYDEAPGIVQTMADDTTALILWDEETIGQRTQCFTVHVPSAQWNDLPVVRTIVEHYRIASRKPIYKIRQ